MPAFLDLTAKLHSGHSLAPDEIRIAAAALLDPAVVDLKKADFLRELGRKGETDTEIAGFAAAFLERAVNPGLDPAALPGPLLDCCGTGGDRLDLFNVSTTAMFVLAAGGVCVVKHGNRSITSKCGGADVLEALGIRIDLPPADFRRGMERIGFGFMFAPHYHPSFRAVAATRKILNNEGSPSIFNLLGPILNPARPTHQLVGVFSKAALPKFADILRQLGRVGAWAVHGNVVGGGGMDELSTLGITDVWALDRSGISPRTVDPEELGLELAPSLESLQGGDKNRNAELLLAVLQGERGPRRDIVLLNAAAGFVVAGIAATMAAGLALAGELIDSGKAMEKLKALRDFS